MFCIYVIRYIIKSHSAFQNVICLFHWRRSTSATLSNPRFLFRATLSRVRVTRAGVRNTSSDTSELTRIRFTRNPGALHNTRPYERERLFRIPWGLKLRPLTFTERVGWGDWEKRPGERDRNVTSELSAAFRATSPPWPRRKFTTTLVSSTVFSYWGHLQMDAKRTK